MCGARLDVTGRCGKGGELGNASTIVGVSGLPGFEMRETWGSLLGNGARKSQLI